MQGADGDPRLTDPPGGADPAPGRPRGGRRARRIALGVGIALLAWAALHLAEASRQGSGASFETRPTYDQVKRRAHEALPGALVRGILGLGLVAWGLSGSRRGPADGRGDR